jgi:hypothetical protein
MDKQLEKAVEKEVIKQRKPILDILYSCSIEITLAATAAFLSIFFPPKGKGRRKELEKILKAQKRLKTNLNITSSNTTKSLKETLKLFNDTLKNLKFKK